MALAPECVRCCCASGCSLVGTPREKCLLTDQERLVHFGTSLLAGAAAWIPGFNQRNAVTA